MDPQEWGDISLNKKEMDVAMQAAAFESFKPTRDKAQNEYK